MTETLLSQYGNYYSLSHRIMVVDMVRTCRQDHTAADIKWVAGVSVDIPNKEELRGKVSRMGMGAYPDQTVLGLEFLGGIKVVVD